MGTHGSSLSEVLGGVLGGEPRAQDPRDVAERRRMIRKLFALFRERDVRLAELYVELTESIPRRVLAYALRSVVESHVWRTLPTVAEIVQAARQAAGMDRERYEAGRYVPAPREWPPESQRWAVTGGTEPLEMCRPEGERERLLPAEAGR